jgi:hypothetical protein
MQGLPNQLAEAVNPSDVFGFVEGATASLGDRYASLQKEALP